jgi:hypothetical protein
MSYPTGLRFLQQLLRLPLEHYDDVMIVLSLNNYHKILRHLGYENKRETCLLILDRFLGQKVKISNVADAKKLVGILFILLENQSDGSEFVIEDYVLCGQIMHLVGHENPKDEIKVKRVVSAYFSYFLMYRICFKKMLYPAGLPFLL